MRSKKGRRGGGGKLEANGAVYTGEINSDTWVLSGLDAGEVRGLPAQSEMTPPLRTLYMSTWPRLWWRCTLLCICTQVGRVGEGGRPAGRVRGGLLSTEAHRGAHTRWGMAQYASRLREGICFLSRL